MLGLNSHMGGTVARPEYHLLVGQLGMYGFSFGAATALEVAGRDPRVRAVVAVAPYSSLRDAASHVIRTRIPGANYLAADQWIDQTIREAGRQGGFDWQKANPTAAIQRTDAMVLLVHGDADNFVQPYHSMFLHRAARDHSRVALVTEADHHDLAEDKIGTAASLALSWFNHWIPAAPSPQLGNTGHQTLLSGQPPKPGTQEVRSRDPRAGGRLDRETIGVLSCLADLGLLRGGLKEEKRG